MLNKSAPYFIIIVLALVSYKVVDIRTLSKENINYRNNVQTSILKGEIQSYNQHGVFSVAAIYILQKAAYAVVHNSLKAYSLAVQFFNIIIFLIIYISFYKYLRIFFSDELSVTGILILGVTIPLSVAGAWPESDYVNLALYIIGFLLMFKSKDLFLPLVFIIGVLNGLQILFLFVFYLIFLITNRKVSSVKSYASLSVIVLFILLTAYFVKWKFRIDPLDFESNLMLNLSNAGLIFQLWLAEFLILLAMAFKGYKYSSTFFRISLVILLLYFVVFLTFGKMNEPGKFLPALLILIPISLNYFSKTIPER